MLTIFGYEKDRAESAGHLLLYVVSQRIQDYVQRHPGSDHLKDAILRVEVCFYLFERRKGDGLMVRGASITGGIL
jgi:cAMP phosphodiesterase